MHLSTIIIGMLSIFGDLLPERSEIYSPNDTRLFVTNTSCQSLILKTNGPINYKVSFLMLNSTLNLDKSAKPTTILSARVKVEKEEYYVFYMNPQSELTVSAHFMDSTVQTAMLYIIHGHYNGRHLWNASVVAQKEISLNNTSPITFSVDDADFYSILFYSISTSVPLLHLEVNMSISRTNFKIDHKSIISACILHTSNFGSSCSLDVPQQSTKSYALLTINPVIPDDSDKILLKVTCAPHVWVYALPLLLAWLICIILWYKIIYAGFIPVILLALMFIGFVMNSSMETFNANYWQSYSPVGTRIIPFSNLFCHSLILENNHDNAGKEHIASLHLLTSPPQLSERKTFSVSEKIAHKDWHYIIYLHSGSQVTITMCFVSKSAIVPLTKLYIVRGHHHEYSKEPLKANSMVAEFDVNYDCAGSSAQPFVFSTSESDLYQFVFHTKVIGVAPVLNIDVKMLFNLTLYTKEEDSIIRSCSFSTHSYESMCSLDVASLFNETFALLTVKPTDIKSSLDKIPLSITCKPHTLTHILMYVSNTLSVLLYILQSIITLLRIIWMFGCYHLWIISQWIRVVFTHILLYWKYASDTVLSALQYILQFIITLLRISLMFGCYHLLTLSQWIKVILEYASYAILLLIFYVVHCISPLFWPVQSLLSVLCNAACSVCEHVCHITHLYWSHIIQSHIVEKIFVLCSALANNALSFLSQLAGFIYVLMLWILVIILTLVIGYCFMLVYILVIILTVVIGYCFMFVCVALLAGKKFHPAKLQVAPLHENSIIANKFKRDWVKGTAPQVRIIFKLKNKNRQRWKKYKSRLDEATIEKHYHGTKLCCNLSDSQQYCEQTDCGACRISETGFSRLKIRSNISFQRFGPGFYLAPNSSKANDYARGDFGKAIILCDVCPGKKYRIRKTDQNLDGPPHGYHSIYGEAGNSLNYDEIVLSNPDAILPRYLIIY